MPGTSVAILDASFNFDHVGAALGTRHASSFSFSYLLRRAIQPHSTDRIFFCFCVSTGSRTLARPPGRGARRCHPEPSLASRFAPGLSPQRQNFPETVVSPIFLILTEHPLVLAAHLCQFGYSNEPGELHEA
ncbi:hypothetical protein GSI_09877 [Ganoderma sinense ZZ0214-1]|uniref:Uncharacterized protein n=1 Tax=Ganoderma sinense ZZ0214-1 TaxID=1077348 RepID=A0A2G8S2N1_9APHY|nr:hypothetical protein GSI_09877 [Ganoderma sinense ZZ0214-1]